MDKFSLPVNLAADNASAEIRLFRPIGSNLPNGIDGAQIADDIALLEAMGVKKLKVRVNSYGGSVLDGMSIISAMRNSKMKITASVEGIAASIASVFVVAAESSEIVDYGLMMSHKAHYLNGQGDPDALDKFNASILAIYAGRMGKEAKDVSFLMPDEGEYWIDSAKALELGIVNKIIPTKAKNLVNQAQELINKEALPMGVADIMNFFNEQIEQKPKKMNQEILNALELGAESDSKMIVNAISALKTALTEKDVKIEGLNAEIVNKGEELTSLQEKLNGFEAKEAARIEKEAEAVVDKAIADRKITNESREKWLGFAKVSLDNTKEILNSITPSKKLSEVTQEDDIEAGTFKGKSMQEVMNSIEGKTKI